MSGRRARLLFGAVLASALACVIGLSFSPIHHARVPEAARPLRAPERVSLASSPEPQLPISAVTAATEPVSAEPEPRRPSHPITPAHQRIFRENNLIGRLNAAMDLEDFTELKRLNAEYREAYPEDAHQLQEAYDLIASCQEQRTEATQRAAGRFWSVHRASTLRRYLRRYCLE